MNADRQPRLGEAGRCGDEVRSDAWFRVEMRDAGDLELDVRSRVEAYYGDNIRSQVRSLCEMLDVKHAHIEMDDRGALPFAIAARLECAVQRA